MGGVFEPKAQGAAGEVEDEKPKSGEMKIGDFACSSANSRS
jgi:hypothetical protein